MPFLRYNLARNVNAMFGVNILSINYEYKIVDEEIVITKYTGNETSINIPSYIDGKIVRKIGPYAFVDRREIVKISLPESINTIEGHAFYNCRGLEILELFDLVLDIDDGAFKNCSKVWEIVLHRRNGKITCLRSLLSEMAQEILVFMNYPTSEKAVVTFPKYMFDYVDNVEARIINQITYGSGVHYRECMDSIDIDFRKYDATFSIAKVNDTFETLLRIVLGRLEYPYQLQEGFKEQYLEFLEVNMELTIEKLVENNMMDHVIKLVDMDWFTKEKLNLALEISYRKNNVEFSAYFLTLKNKSSQVCKKTFEL